MQCLQFRSESEVDEAEFDFGFQKYIAAVEGSADDKVLGMEVADGLSQLLRGGPFQIGGQFVESAGIIEDLMQRLRRFRWLDDNQQIVGLFGGGAEEQEDIIVADFRQFLHLGEKLIDAGALVALLEDQHISMPPTSANANRKL